MLDLEYGLPVQVRDHALRIKDDLPKSDANREYYLQNVDAQLASSDVVGPGGALGKLPSHKVKYPVGKACSYIHKVF